MADAVVTSTAAELAFWGATLVTAYSYVGYPALLALAAWLRPARPVAKAPITPTVAVIVVARNEERVLEAKLASCLSLDYPRGRLEILVVSDGSEDATERIASSFADRGVRLVALPAAGGKAAGLNAGVAQTGAEILVLTDARQRLAVDAVRQLVANFADPSVGAVSGELHLDEDSPSAVGQGVGLYWTYEKWIRQAESRLDSSVGVTGAIYAVRRVLFRGLDPRTILDDVAVPMSAVLAGYRVVFEPGARATDTLAESPAREYRRKVRTLAGNYQLLLLEPTLLLPWRNRLFWQFVSHKVSRLAVPWCLLALLAASAVLSRERTAYGVAFALQAAFYFLAALGWALSRFHHPMPFLSVPYTFALLNVAAALGLIRLLRGTETAAWKEASR